VTIDLENMSRSKVKVICLFLLFLSSFSKKKKSTPYYVSKNYLHHYIGHVEKSLSPMLCLWTLTSYELIDKLRKILVIGLSQKPLTLHAWKCIYNDTLIRWQKRTFVIACSMILKRVIALEIVKNPCYRSISKTAYSTCMKIHIQWHPN
jgi:hypothetical protein